MSVKQSPQLLLRTVKVHRMFVDLIEVFLHLGSHQKFSRLRFRTEQRDLISRNVPIPGHDAKYLSYFLQHSEPTVKQVQLHLAGSGPRLLPCDIRHHASNGRRKQTLKVPNTKGHAV